MLHVNDLTFRIQGEPLLEEATVAVHKGERVGLVGRNGCGKTTLLRLISGELQADGGGISIQSATRVGWLPQEAPGGPESLIATVLAADKERTALLARLEGGAPPEELGEIHERLVTIEADSAPARAARILAGLGFDEAAQQRPCAEFSGGWRMRVSLASLLFSNPDLLLLDEPSNHLDLEANLWLENFLRGYPGAFLLVSHDRGLLNRSVDRIIHVEGRKLTSYGGNYDRFERTRLEHQKTQAALYAHQQAERRHIQAFIDRFRYQANKARQAQSRIKALERMQPLTQVTESGSVNFDFPAAPALSPPILTLEGASVGYRPDQPVLQELDLRLDMDDRVALLGANGNGKSTLARLLASQLKVQDGHMTRSSKLKVGYFSQDQADMLDYGATPLAHLARLMPQAPETRLRAQLGRFAFGAGRAQVEVGKLSGGEKARLLFALISRDHPHLLILDEPTNHLDMDSRQALVEALGAFEGAVLLITHDPHLVSLIADRLWLVADGTVKSFDGDLEDYRRLLTDQRRLERERARDDRAPNTEASANKKDRRRESARRLEATADLRRAVKKAEGRIESLNTEVEKLEKRLAEPGLYEELSTAKMMEIQTRHATLKGQIVQAEEAWMTAQEALEAGKPA